MKTDIQKAITFTLIALVLLTFSFQQALAVGLSTYRIKLDVDSPEYEFIVFNKSVIQQECRINLTDMVFNSRGDRIELKGKQAPEISAKKHLRYSPRAFTLEGNGSQSVRFQYRRKRSDSPEELRSYLSLMCEDALAEGGAEFQVSVKPKLRINIPIIVRTADLPVELAFPRINYDGNKLLIGVTKSGERSIYGNLEVVHKNTGEVIRSQKAFSMHAEVTHATHQFDLPNANVDDLDIQFIEDQKLSGNLIIKQSIR